jgi:hypothetical protein
MKYSFQSARIRGGIVAGVAGYRLPVSPGQLATGNCHPIQNFVDPHSKKSGSEADPDSEQRIWGIHIILARKCLEIEELRLSEVVPKLVAFTPFFH